MKTSRFSVLALLILGFGLACILLAATIALGLKEQNQLNGITTQIVADRWPNIELASKVQLGVSDVASHS